MGQDSFAKRTSLNKEPPALLWIACLLVGGVLRLYAISAQSLWLDEATSLLVASRSYKEIAAGVGFDNHTPPFYYLLLHLWLLAVPKTEFGLRSLSAVIDLASIPMIYVVASRLCNRRVGLVSSFLFAISPFAIYYAQEGRMYSLLMFLVLSVSWSAAVLLERPLSLTEVFLTVAAAIGGLYTHYYFALYLFALTLVMLFMLRHDCRRTLQWFGAMLIAGLAFLPWLKIVLTLSSSEGQSFRRFVWLVLPYTFLRFCAGYSVLPINYGSKDDLVSFLAEHWSLATAYSVVFIGISAHALFALFRQWRNCYALLLAGLFIPGLAALLISLKVPMLGERYLAVSFPFFVILIAYGLQTPTVKRLAVTMLFVVCFLWCFSLHEYYFSPQFGKTQWRKAANIVKTQGQPTQVVVHPGFIDILLRFYLPEKYSISDARDVLPSLPNAGDCRSSPVASEGFWLIERGSVPTLIPQLTSKGYQPAIEQLLPLENGIRLLMFPCLPSSGTVFGNE